MRTPHSGRQRSCRAAARKVRSAENEAEEPGKERAACVLSFHDALRKTEQYLLRTRNRRKAAMLPGVYIRRKNKCLHINVR